YLIKQHTICISPSIQIAYLKRKHKNDSRWMQSLLNPSEMNILVIGNPDPMPKIDGIPLSCLPGSEQEAKEISNLLNINPITGSNATKQIILDKLDKSLTIAHFATHGLLEYN